ncbi:hypothetical protein [Salinibacter phage M31CR41-2]|uniref:Uncharacterized protein n=1 Tax=Salinibacter phage M31CR41-2 TaxID=2681614 RepID=A0A2I6UH31_9CAUD|nr:hypothetical protein FGG68_gp59 [Salinibacter phage M31CR41-2]AUO79293.1 hypothetical protein [Salinibacter phage M31CR41-2]
MQENFTLHLGWCRFHVPIGTFGDSNGNEYLLPVGTLKIMLTPVVDGERGGPTVIEDVNSVSHYNADGWAHDVELSYAQIPKQHHGTLLDLVRDLNAGQGEATFAPAQPDGSPITTKSIDLVAAFGQNPLPTEFSDRARQRPATLKFNEKTPKDDPYAWLTD